MSGTTQLFYVTSGAVTADTTLTDLALNSDTLVASDSATSFGTALNGVPVSVALVPQDGVYFIDAITNGNATAAIYEEHAGQALSFTSTAFTVSETNAMISSALAVDAADNIIYVTDGTALLAERFGASFSGTPVTVDLGTLIQATTIYPSGALVYDAADHTGYYAGVSGSVSTTFSGTVANITGNYIYKISGLTKSATAGGVSISDALGGTTQVPLQDGLVESMALDSATDTLYFTTRATPGVADGEAGIYALALSGAKEGQLSTVWSEVVTNTLSPLASMGTITLDAATGQYYIASGDDILTGNISLGTAPTVLASNSAETPDGVAVDAGPAVASLALLAVDDRAVSGSTLLSLGDSATFALTLSEAVSLSGATLSLNDGGSATYVSGSGSDVLLFDYDVAAGQDAASLAVTGLTGSITDDFGTALGDTLSASFAQLRVDTNPPTLSLTGTSGEALQGGAAVALLAAASITAATGSLTGASLLIADAQSGDSLAIGGAQSGTLDGGAISFAVTGDTLVLTGTAAVAAYAAALDEITYQDGGSDNSAGTPTRTLDWTVTQDGLSSSLVTSTIEIDRALTLTAGASVTVQPGASATLDSTLTLTDLNADPVTSATIAITGGFAVGEQLAIGTLGGLSASFDATTGVLALTGSASAATYQQALDSVIFTQGNASPAGTLVTLSYVAADAAGDSNNATSELAICYLHGTRILTLRGEAKVEDLVIGEEIVTRLGGVRRLKWLGRQSYAAPFLQRNPSLWPVRISAGALGGGLPLRDLWVSPGHSMLLGETLVLARNLINGLTITQDPPRDAVHYVQLEFETHDCVLANGAWSESFVDGPDLRARFHNQAEFAALYPAHVTPAEIIPCRPRPLCGPLLAASLAPVHELARARTRPGRLLGFVDQIRPDGFIEGWAWDEANPRLPVWLTIMLHGREVATVLACDYRGDLEAAGFAQGQCLFAVQLPQQLSPADMAALEVRRVEDHAPLGFTPGAMRLAATLS